MTDTRLFQFVVTAPQSWMPAWLTSSSAEVNQWFEIPHTALSAATRAGVIPSAGDPLSVLWNTPQYKTDAWTSAALRRNGSIFIIGAAGGHGNYAGNEVDTLNLRADDPVWKEIRPGSHPDVAMNDAAVYLDFRSAARHNYCGLHHIAQDDRLVTMPKLQPVDADVLAAREAANAAHVAAYPGGRLMPSFQAVDWTQYNAANDWDAAVIQSTGSPLYASLPVGQNGVTEGVGCMDHSTGNLYMTTDGLRLYKWTRSTNTWANLRSVSSSQYSYTASCFDHTRNRILLIGGQIGTSQPPRVWDGTTGAAVSVDLSALNNSTFIGDYMSSHALIYDEPRDRFLFIKGTNPLTAWAINASTFAVSTFSMANAPGPRSRGLYNSIQYVPELDGLVFCRAYTENTWFMRLS